MKLLGYKASLTLSAIAFVGLGIASTTTTKAASLQATTGISTVFDNCYINYTRSFKDSGQLLSNSTTVNGDSFTFIYSGGQRLYLGTLGSNNTAYDFNHFGLVVGGSKTNAGLFDALLNANSQMQDKGTFGGYFSGNQAFGIDLAGQVLEESKASYDAFDAFLYNASPIQELGYMSANGNQLLLLHRSLEKQRCG
jgi:hypothetical protein